MTIGFSLFEKATKIEMTKLEKADASQIYQKAILALAE